MLDGTLSSCGPPPVGDLPSHPWVGRFWEPSDRVPELEDDAVLSIIDVPDLMRAWDALVSLVEAQRTVDAG